MYMHNKNSPILTNETALTKFFLSKWPAMKIKKGGFQAKPLQRYELFPYQNLNNT